MISLITHDSSEGEQCGRYDLPICIYIYIHVFNVFIYVHTQMLYIIHLEYLDTPQYFLKNLQAWPVFALWPPSPVCQCLDYPPEGMMGRPIPA